jgi:hypothetical protein
MVITISSKDGDKRVEMTGGVALVIVGLAGMAAISVWRWFQ